MSSYILSGLPPEIQDMIIDHLHDHKPSLQACTLVRKQWLPAGRYHLFRFITQKGEEHAYAELLEFLLNARHIRPYIREIRFHGLVSATTLLALLRVLPGLTRVILSDITVHSCKADGSWYDNLLIALLSMEKLNDLRVCGHFPFPQQTLPLSALLACATGLSKLTHFQSYISQNALMLPFWRGLAKAKSAPGVVPLRVLDIPIDLADGNCDDLIAQEFSTLLSCVGHGLHTLMLDFRVLDLDFYFDIDRVLRAIDFSPCLNLRSLEIRILVDKWAQAISLCVVAFILARIPTASLEHLSIAVWNADALEELDAAMCKVPLRDIDEALCGFPKLKQVSFRSVENDCYEPENDTNAALFEAIIGHLPKVEDKEGVAVGYAGEL